MSLSIITATLFIPDLGSMNCVSSLLKPCAGCRRPACFRVGSHRAAGQEGRARKVQTMTDHLHDYLNAISPGPITETGTLDRLLADAWGEFSGDDGGMEGRKLRGRMEEVQWQPPLLTFAIERHGGTVLGSTRATLQEWAVNVDKKTVACVEARHRQLRPRQPRLDVAAIAEEIVSQIVNRQEDHRLKWYEDGRVRVLVGKVLPEESVVKQTLATRRKRFRSALKERLAHHGWQECGVNTYERR